MPKNNSKARKTWRKARVVKFQEFRENPLSQEERLLRAIFGEIEDGASAWMDKPGTDQV